VNALPVFLRGESFAWRQQGNAPVKPAIRKIDPNLPKVVSVWISPLDRECVSSLEVSTYF
jgi:hypothetical protein